MKKEDVAARDAKWSERMIEVKVHFWTDGIADGEGRVLPKNAWTSGVVRIKNNRSHNITAQESQVPFNSLMEIPSVIEKVLIQNGINLHTSNRMKKYSTSS
jgi:hypothetical protein